MTLGPGGLERLNRFALLQDRFGTAVEVNEIDSIGPKSLQAALDALQDRGARPVRPALHSVGMTAFREKVKLFAAMADGLADKFFAVLIALGRVDNI